MTVLVVGVGSWVVFGTDANTVETALEVLIPPINF